MKCLALAAAGAAVAGLAACSHAAMPSAAPATYPVGQVASRHARPSNDDEGLSPPGRLPPERAASQPVAMPPPMSANCKRQYDSWMRGPGKGLVAAVSAVGSAGTTGNPHALSAALKNARPAVASVARYPMPACADPEGYWDALLMHVNAAAGAGSASGFRAAMNGVPEITQKLLAELKRTGG